MTDEIANASNQPRTASPLSRIRGCLLGGAAGDALGSPVEFAHGASLTAIAGPDGVRHFLPGWHGEVAGQITDDTQMTLFTIEALTTLITDGALANNAAAHRVLHIAYLDWLHTQDWQTTHPSTSTLRNERWLYSRRAPGMTCLSALVDAAHDRQPIGAQALNNSKGCGGVMRSAPFGLIHALNPLGADDYTLDAAVTRSYGLAWAAAGLTHGHPTGKVASGAFAVIVTLICAGHGLRAAVEHTLAYLQVKPDTTETINALRIALAAADNQPPTRATVESIGGGWIAEGALAIGVYAALAHPTPTEALEAFSLAVTHDGDADSTGAICGSIIGTLHGEEHLPRLVEAVEGHSVIVDLSHSFYSALQKAEH